MKKNFFPIIVLGACLFLLAGCQKPKPTSGGTQKPPEAPKEETGISSGIEPEKEIPGWQTYKNEKQGYAVKYPQNWFFLEDACCPPPPAYVVLNNYSSKKAEYAAHQMEKGVEGVDISCLYEGKIDDIGEVRLQKKEGIKNSLLKMNSFDAIRFEKDTAPGDPSGKTVSYYVVDGEKGCRIVIGTPCDTCERIATTFIFE